MGFRFKVKTPLVSQMRWTRGRMQRKLLKMKKKTSTHSLILPWKNSSSFHPRKYPFSKKKNFTWNLAHILFNANLIFALLLEFKRCLCLLLKCNKSSDKITNKFFLLIIFVITNLNDTKLRIMTLLRQCTNTINQHAFRELPIKVWMKLLKHVWVL